MTVPLPVKRNAVRCIDCDETYADASLIECPEDPGHAVEAAYVSDTPLGVQQEQKAADTADGVPERRDDPDYWHFGNHRYEYDGDDIVQPIEYPR